MLIYIAGPMTGLPDLNFPAFDAAERQLRDAGYDVLNPTRHGGGDPNKTRLDYLVPCLYDVMAADGVALLDDWETSKGAPVEAKLAQVHDKPVVGIRAWLNRAQDVAG